MIHADDVRELQARGVVSSLGNLPANKKQIAAFGLGASEILSDPNGVRGTVMVGRSLNHPAAIRNNEICISAYPV